MQAGIAVMGHTGLTPQSVSVLGGFRSIGKSAKEAEVVYDQAMRLQDAGCFSVGQDSDFSFFLSFLRCSFIFFLVLVIDRNTIFILSFPFLFINQACFGVHSIGASSLDYRKAGDPNDWHR